MQSPIGDQAHIEEESKMGEIITENNITPKMALKQEFQAYLEQKGMKLKDNDGDDNDEEASKQMKGKNKGGSNARKKNKRRRNDKKLTRMNFLLKLIWDLRGRCDFMMEFQTNSCFLCRNQQASDSISSCEHKTLCEVCLDFLMMKLLEEPNYHACCLVCNAPLNPLNP